MKYSRVKELLKDIGRKKLEELIEQFGADTIDQYIDEGYDINDIEDCHAGYFYSDEDFVQTLLEDCGDLPKDLPPYIHIDWEATARDIMTDYFEINGHYFRA